jgi:hypothetical protein
LSAFTWTGGYVRIQGGYVWSDTQFGDGIGFLFDISKEDMPGGYVSYNQRADLVVFGAEGDINAMWNNGLFAVPRCRS